MKEIIVSAPAKVILAGEHAVVHNFPALLFAIPLRVTVTLYLKDHKESRSVILLRRKIDQVISDALHASLPKYALSVSTDIPIGVGLGSSAAFSIAYVTAIFSLLKKPLSKKVLHSITHECEKVFHGNPSGADSAAIISGGLILFRKKSSNSTEITPIPIPKKAQDTFKKFVLIASGKPKETTKDMVKKVAGFIKKYPAKSSEILDRIGKNVFLLITALKKADSQSITQLLKDCEECLEELGVVGEKAKKIILEIESIGGVGKITGAGGVLSGSGMILGYHENPTILKNYIKDHGLAYFDIAIGTAGVRNEVIHE